LCRGHVESRASPGRQNAGPAQILPVVNVQCEHTHPGATVVRWCRSRHIGETDCVAESAVAANQSANQDSLLTGKLTGNFVDSGPPLQFWVQGQQ
jgi:hypothetical protein